MAKSDGKEPEQHVPEAYPAATAPPQNMNFYQPQPHSYTPYVVPNGESGLSYVPVGPPGYVGNHTIVYINEHADERTARLLYAFVSFFPQAVDRLFTVSFAGFLLVSVSELSEW